jgi:phosphatidylglycerol lysyltransferase
VRGLVKRQVVTLSVIAITIVMTAATGSLSGVTDTVRGIFGMGPAAFIGGASVFSTVTAGLIADGTAALAVNVVAAAVLLGVSERVLGWWRALVVYLGSGMLGSVVGQAIIAIGELLSGRPGSDVPVLDPITPLVGCALAATAFADGMWRRRFRVVGVAALLMLVLYSGTSVDVFRLCGGLAGLVLGMLFTPPARRYLHIARSSHHESRLLLAVLVLIAAVGPVVALLTGAQRGPLHPLAQLFDPYAPDAGACAAVVATADCVRTLALQRIDGFGPVLLALLPLAVLALSALGLLRGRRAAAWIAAITLFIFGTLSALYDGILRLLPDGAQLAEHPDLPAAVLPDVLAIAAPIGLGVSLLANLRRFPVRPSARLVRRFWYIVGGTAAIVSSAYIVLGGFAASHFEPPVTVLSLIIDLPERFVPAGFLHLRLLEFVPDGAVAVALYSGIGPLFWLATLIATGLLLGGAAGRDSESDSERLHILLRDGASGSLSHMAAWHGNSYWFSRDDGSAVAYRVVSGVALTVGGPIGSPEFRRDALRGFAAHCDDNGWIPAFYSVDAELRPLFAELGWSTTEIGDDAVIIPAAFSLAGGRFKDVRTSINRAAKLGVVASWTTWSELSRATRAQIEAISEEWVSARGLPEMGFTLGGIDELDDPEVRLMMAVDAAGVVLAVTSWMPTYRDGRVIGWTLDFMRRRTESMNGVVEYLIAETVRRAATEEREFISLSAAPLSRVSAASAEEGVAAHVLGYVGNRLESLYGFRSLLTFKQKFGPEFRPLVIAYPDPLVLPAVGIALSRAYLPSMTVQQTVSVVRALLRAPERPEASEELPVG